MQGRATGGVEPGTVLSFLATLALVVASTWARVQVALADPQFDAHDATGLLKSDPGLLYALTDRIVAAGGAAPQDFSADRLVEHPAIVDDWERFPLGQLFAVAWTHLALDGAAPLHVTCLWVSAAFASAALLGVWLLALELSRRPVLAFLAALLAASTPAFHRTIGFVLVDEDFSWPFLALHLGLTARAARLRTPAAVALAALALALALATWHAASFVAALEALALLGVLAATGRSPLSVRGGWLAPAILVAACLAVPFLRASGAATSLPVAAAIGLSLAALTPSGARARVVGLGATATVVAVGAIARAGEGAYGHVVALLVAKLAHAGLRPQDASALDPEVRLMWQGPFETLAAGGAVTQLALAGLAGLLGVVLAARHRERATLALALLFVRSIGAAWFAQRLVVLPALIAPALAAAALSRERRGALVLALGAGAQLALGAAWLARHENPWYHAPAQRQAELRWLVGAVRAHVPAGEAVAADFMTSTAILAHAGNPICFSPKWEAAEPRRRAAELIESFHHRSPEELRRMLLDEYRVRWLVVDRFTLGFLARWSAGLEPGARFVRGSAAEALLSQDEATLRSVPGYELVARSPGTIRQSNGAPTDFYRLFRLAP